jgi:hypothetical protein
MMPPPRIALFCGSRIVANVVTAGVIISLLANPARDLTPICLLSAVAVGLWFGPRGSHAQMRAMTT